MADNKYIFNMNDAATLIKWYKNEQEIKNDPDIEVLISDKEIEEVQDHSNGTIPEDRLKVIAANRKKSELAKELLSAQSVLSKSDFSDAVNRFLSAPIEESLESKDILLNVLALMDRRVGKKRLLGMAERMKLKHPIVKYFYDLRINGSSM